MEEKFLQTLLGEGEIGFCLIWLDTFCLCCLDCFGCCCIGNGTCKCVVVVALCFFNGDIACKEVLNFKGEWNFL